MRAKEDADSARQREAGRRDALPCMLVTELTSQLDRSELKEEAPRNTAREDETGESEGADACTRQAKGRPGGGTHSQACR